MTHRPGYHLTAPTNWLNDPNGLVHHDGVHHVFYQHNPHAPEWGPPSWGHYSSPDLLTWTEHPVALAPGPDGPDRDGCWSGCVVVVDGTPTAFYTGVVGEPGAGAVRVESVCRAFGSRDLVSWRKDPANPLIAGAPAGLGVHDHRDPFVFHRDGRWQMLLASGFADERGQPGGAVLRYDSDDLATWRYRGVLYRRPAGDGPVDTGDLWECPQLAVVDGHDVLVFSVQWSHRPSPLLYAAYAIGTLADDGFHADAVGRLDHGDVFYAPAVMRTPDGRHLMWGWLQERAPATERGADHAGALSLPRSLHVDGDRLTVRPARELTGLRTAGRTLGAVTAAPDGSAGRTTSLPGPHVELEASVSGRAGTAGLALVDGAGDGCRIELDLARRRLRVTTADAGPADGTVELPSDLDTALRIFVDATIVEIFVDGRTALTVRSAHPPATELRLTATGDARVDDVTLHVLPSSVVT